jgi:hypothetical protein
MKRKYISWKTRCASAVLALMDQTDPGGLGYAEAKLMTEDQFLSLFQWDHNMLHAFEGEDRDSYYNLTPMLIMAHRRKTKADAKIIAKSKRIRKRQSLVEIGHLLANAVKDNRASPSEAVAEAMTEGFLRGVRMGKRKMQSRGFDKTRRKKMSGKVEKR